MTPTTRQVAAAVASGLAFLAPAGGASEPRVPPAPAPHVRLVPAAQPASAPALSLEQRAYRLTFRGPWDGLIAQAAMRQGLEPHLLRALLWEESKLRPGAVNPVSGALGIAQSTHRGRRGINERRCLRRVGRRACRLGDHEYTRAAALDPEQAIPAAAEHLGDLVRRWGVPRGVAHYNGGRLKQLFAQRVLRTANRFRVESGLPPLRDRQWPRPPRLEA